MSHHPSLSCYHSTSLLPLQRLFLPLCGRINDARPTHIYLTARFASRQPFPACSRSPSTQIPFLQIPQPPALQNKSGHSWGCCGARQQFAASPCLPWGRSLQTGVITHTSCHVHATWHLQLHAAALPARCSWSEVTVCPLCVIREELGAPLGDLLAWLLLGQCPSNFSVLADFSSSWLFFTPSKQRYSQVNFVVPN